MNACAYMCMCGVYVGVGDVLAATDLIGLEHNYILCQITS